LWTERKHAGQCHGRRAGNGSRVRGRRPVPAASLHFHFLDPTRPFCGARRNRSRAVRRGILRRMAGAQNALAFGSAVPAHRAGRRSGGLPHRSRHFAAGRYRWMTGYSSLVAYLAHWRALQREQEKNPAPPKSSILEEMNRAAREILGEEDRYLQEEPPDPAARRHRDRAEAKLRRELIARGTISE